MADFDYRKLPGWWRNAGNDPSKWRELCIEGKHVPVQAIYPDGHSEYLCQNCGKEMTEKEWHNFFDKARR